MSMRLTLAALAAPFLLVPTAQAGEPVTYSVAGADYEGYHASPTRGSKGLVILIHDWDG